PQGAEAIRWSEASSTLVVQVPNATTGVRIAGVLTPAPRYAGGNELTMQHGDGDVVRVLNDTEQPVPFEAVVPLRHEPQAETAVIRFETAHRFCPAEEGS